MHFEYHPIWKNITFIHITLLIVRYAYVSGSSPMCKTVYLAHQYEPKTKSANFVKKIQIYFENNSLWTNTGPVNINILIVNKCFKQPFSVQDCLPSTYVITMK